MTIFFFQNCSTGFEPAVEEKSLASLNQDQFSDLVTEQGASIVNVEASILPSGRTWNLEWSDEFKGPSGQKPGGPWVFHDGFSSEFKYRDATLTEQDAFLDGNSNLVMRAVVRNGRPETSYIRTTSFKDGQNFLEGPPSNLILDPSPGPLYIETSVKFDQAYQSEDAWWAFWLFGADSWDETQNALFPSYNIPGIPRMDPYDGNAQSGMEVDIFEYVPYLGPNQYGSRNGFNMAAYTQVNPVLAQHMDTPDNGFVGNVNNFLTTSTGQAPNPPINLTDGRYHKIGMYWDMTKYEFFVDGYKIWEITDPNFITRTRAQSIVLSWEVENGTWGDNTDRTFITNNRDVFVLVDYVRVFRAEN